MARGASRVGIDRAVGLILGPGSPNVFVNNAKQSLVGDSVQGHAPGVHSAPSMVEGSPNVFANGISCVRQGDKASCNDVATGSDNVFIN